MHVPRANDRLRGPRTCGDSRVVARQNSSCAQSVKVRLVVSGTSYGTPARCGAGHHRNPSRRLNDRKLLVLTKTGFSRRRSAKCMTIFRAGYETSCTRTGQVCEHTWSRRGTTTAFKLNLSYGFILKEKQSGRPRYYHSSCNCCGRLLEEPSFDNESCRL